MNEIEGAKRYASVDPAANLVQDVQQASQPAYEAVPELTGHALIVG